MYHSCLCLVSDTRTSENKNLAIAVHFGAILPPCWELRWLSETPFGDAHSDAHGDAHGDTPFGDAPKNSGPKGVQKGCQKETQRGVPNGGKSRPPEKQEKVSSIHYLLCFSHIEWSKNDHFLSSECPVSAPVTSLQVAHGSTLHMAPKWEPNSGI